MYGKKVVDEENKGIVSLLNMLHIIIPAHKYVSPIKSMTIYE